MDDLSSLEAVVERGFTTRHEAASVGERIFRAHAAEASALDSIPLVSRFKHAVEEAGLEPILLSSRIDYAERLAASPGQLLDEEMHKLLHLCQQVLALQAFGYQAAPDVVEQYVASVSAKLHAERSVASQVCEALGLTASHSFWQKSGIAPPQVR